MKYIFGASGHAKVVLEVINSVNDELVLGVFDDNKHIESFLGIPFLGKYKNKKSLPPEAKMLVSIGDNKIRKKIVNQLPVDFFTAKHKSCQIATSSTVDIGTVIMSNVVVNPFTEIGKHCIINTSCVIEHDCKIEDFAHISPNATITGNVVVGEGTHIGAGATVIPNIKIGKWCVVGAGSVVIEDIPDFSVVVGNPARIIKKKK